MSDAGLDSDEEQYIVLISNGERPARFELDKQYALSSKLVANIVEGDAEAKEIEIKQVDAGILKHIVEFLEYHKGVNPAEITKPIRSVKMDKIVEDPWDAEFINKLPQKELFQLILGANYMDCKSLLHLGCAKVATMIKGKSPEEIKSILGDGADSDKK